MEGLVRREMLSNRVRAIKPSGIRKYFDIAATMSDVISLGVGEPDFVTPEHIRQAGIRAIERGETKYTSNYGTLELRSAISALLTTRYGVTYDPASEVLVTVGVSEGIDAALRALLDDGDEVLIPNPGYVAYEADVTLAGGVVVPVTTSVDDHFEVKAAAIEAALTPRSKVLLLGNPSPSWPCAAISSSSATRCTVGWFTATSTPASPRCPACASARFSPTASPRRMR
jgi:aminotransferase